MPRYFFNIENHVSDEDHTGLELVGPDKARVTAVRFAGEYLSHNPSLIWDGQRFRVEVKDEKGGLLLRISVVAETPDLPD